ncbi:MAG TPA: IPT/TIG domain-containing protein [Sandaracinaceae bacterium]
MSSRIEMRAKHLGLTIALAIFAAVAAACGGESGELEVTNIDPRAGATAGEQPVRILGNNFRQDIGYTVYFGNKRSMRATILNEHTLVVSSPPMDAPGAVDVVVAADNGPAFRIRQGFRYEDMSGNVMERVGNTSATGAGEERF